MGFKITPLLQEHICRIGSKLPFEEAAEELTLLLGVQVNSKQVERLCHCYGEQIDKVDWNMAHSQGVQLKITESETDPIYCRTPLITHFGISTQVFFSGTRHQKRSLTELNEYFGNEVAGKKTMLKTEIELLEVSCMADGSMLLTREEKWKEIKLGRTFSEKSHATNVSKNRSMIGQSVYCAHFGNSDDFWERFHKEIPINKKLVFICDGAKWLWNNIEVFYPESIQILDFYHCKEHICGFSKEYFKGNPAKGEQFVNDIIDKLTSKRVDEALKEIEALNAQNERKSSEKRKLLTYLTNNKKRVDYGRFKEEGLLIGSGPIESANRDIIQKRLKLSGQRWTIKGAQQIANLIVTLKSNRWSRVLSLINGYQMAA